MVGRSWLHEPLRLTPSDVEPNSAAVVGGGDGIKSPRCTFLLTRGIVDYVRQAAQWSPNHTRQSEPHLSHGLQRLENLRAVGAIKTAQYGIEGSTRVVARSHPMSRKDQNKRVFT